VSPLCFGFRSSAGHADHSNCIDPRDVASPPRIVSNLPNCVTTMHSSDTAYNLPPFPAYPSIERFIGLGSVQDAVERIERSIQARDAISVVIGPPGTGKTLISELLADRYRQSHRVISLGETTFADSDSFLRRILHQLGADIGAVPDGDYQLALFDHLCLGDGPQPRLLLLVDEAQSLTPTILETIRTLTNLTRHAEPRVNVVLFGGNYLDELLIASSMDSFRQRISTRCYLHPLNAEETGWYINQTIRNCGCDPEATITADAISAVHHACSGLPRLINQLLTQAIEFAAQNDEYLITDRIIDQSWAELQQLPSPMIDQPDIKITASEVEFGELEALDSPATDSSFGVTRNSIDTEISDTPDADTSISEHASTDAADEYDAYDFEPNGTFPVSREIESEEFNEPSPDLWQDEPPSVEVSAERALDTAAEALDEVTNSLPNDLIANEDFSENDATSIPQLHYPQLASPALEPEIDADLTPDTMSEELFHQGAKTPTGNALFGSFDEEEQILLEASSSTAESPIKSGESTADESGLNHDIREVADILTSGESGTIQYCDGAHQLPSHMHQNIVSANSESLPFDEAEQGYQESTVDSETLEFISANSKPTEDQTLQNQTGQTESQAEPARAENSTDHELKIHPRHDDSDLLIIEEEVDLHRFDKGQAANATRQNTPDYKRMLKRMRTKN